MTTDRKIWGKARFTVKSDDGTTRTIIVQGRDRWTLETLMARGERGLTAIELNGPRIHAYVHDLRHEHGLSIERKDEPHSGDFPGRHGRYFLRSNVTRAEGEAA